MKLAGDTQCFFSKDVLIFGLCTYYHVHRFARSSSDVARPLHELSGEGESFKGKKDAMINFSKSKLLLCLPPCLHTPTEQNTFY